MNLDLSPQALQRAATRAGELFTEIYAKLEERSVYPGAMNPQLRSQLAKSIGEEGVGLDKALDEFATQILPNAMGTPNPMYFGLVNSSPLPAGPLADLLVSSLNNNGGSSHQSPSISALEEAVVIEFARLCGLDHDASGMILPGGTFANLQGLLLARQTHFPHWHQQGPAALGGQPRLYRSASTHFCNDRAASVLGIGQSGLIPVESQGRGEINADALDQQIGQDREAGHLPFAVVANAGTTGTGAIDDLDAVASVCEKHQVWLHVDACYGGGALVLPEPPRRLAGIHRADSIAIDPHKWFFIPMTAGLLLTRHSNLELETFDIAAPYIPSDGSVDAFRRGLPTSRRSSGLTIWMTLRAHGWKVIREAVQRDIDLVRDLESQLGRIGFRVLPDGELSVACVRWEPADTSDDDLDELQTRITEDVIASGQAWFSTCLHDGLRWIRLNLVNIHTRQHHIDAVAQLLADAAGRCSR